MKLQCLISIIIYDYIVLHVSTTLDVWHNFESKCYLISSDDNDFPYIKSDCENDFNGNLMVIKNEYELDFIQQKLSGLPHDMEFFLGLEVRNATSGKVFTWSDASFPLPDFWGDGYPLDPNNNHCAVLTYIPSQNKWLIRDWDAWDDTYYVCEKPGTLIDGNFNPDFKSTISDVTTISQLDKDNMCVLKSTNDSSDILCSDLCISMSCYMFGFDVLSKTCEVFIVREEPCTTMSYNPDVKYFKVDYGARYKC